MRWYNCGPFGNKFPYSLNHNLYFFNYSGEGFIGTVQAALDTPMGICIVFKMITDILYKTTLYTTHFVLIYVQCLQLQTPFTELKVVSRNSSLFTQKAHWSHVWCLYLIKPPVSFASLPPCPPDSLSYHSSICSVQSSGIPSYVK